MTPCSIKAFVEFWERDQRAVLGFAPAYQDLNSRQHILLTSGKVVGRTLCNLGRLGTPFERGGFEDGALPCARCFDKARMVAFRHQRKEEEQPGTL